MTKIQLKLPRRPTNPEALELVKDAHEEKNRLNEIETETQQIENNQTSDQNKMEESNDITDENPKDTVSVEFSSAAAIRRTLSKPSFKSKSHKRQSQIINLYLKYPLVLTLQFS